MKSCSASFLNGRTTKRFPSTIAGLMPERFTCYNHYLAISSKVAGNTRHLPRFQGLIVISLSLPTAFKNTKPHRIWPSDATQSDPMVYLSLPSAIHTKLIPSPRNSQPRNRARIHRILPSLIAATTFRPPPPSSSEAVSLPMTVQDRKLTLTHTRIRVYIVSGWREGGVGG